MDGIRPTGCAFNRLGGRRSQPRADRVMHHRGAAVGRPDLDGRRGRRWGAASGPSGLYCGVPSAFVVPGQLIGAPNSSNRESEKKSRRWPERSRTRSSAGGWWRRTPARWRSCACTTSPPPSWRPPPSPRRSDSLPSPLLPGSSCHRFRPGGLIRLVSVSVSQAKSVKRKRAPREPGEDAPLRRSSHVTSIPDKPKWNREVIFIPAARGVGCLRPDWRLRE
jgi:hypothetical protein